MKKTFKRAGVAVLSMAMLLSMGAVGITANAAKDNTTDITVTAPATLGASAATYNIYKVCAATPNASGTAYTYTMAAGFTTSVNEILDCADNAAAKKALADTLVSDASDALPVATVKSGESTTLIAGYYLAIMDPTGTTMTAAPILFSVDSETNASGITLAAKTSEVGVAKTIESVDKGSVASGKKDAQGAIGATVSYKVEATLPNYAETVNPANIEYYLVDTPSTGLTVATGSVAVDSAGLSSSDYTVKSNTQGIKVKVNGDFVKAHGGQAVTLTYDAVINENALISTDDTANANPNTVKLYYDNDYYTASSEGEPGTPNDPADPPKPPTTPGAPGLTEKDDSAEVYTTKLVFKKLFNGDDVKIAGASFTLTGPNSFSQTFSTTASQNEFTFNGLEAGTYTLTETAAPGGYAKVETPITIVITADTEATDVYTFAYTGANSSNKETFTMNNPPKGFLPGTGGMGTVLFTVGGAAIVLLAGALFVVYMRKRKADEE